MFFCISSLVFYVQTMVSAKQTSVRAKTPIHRAKLKFGALPVLTCMTARPPAVVLARDRLPELDALRAIRTLPLCVFVLTCAPLSSAFFLGRRLRWRCGRPIKAEPPHTPPIEGRRLSVALPSPSFALRFGFSVSLAADVLALLGRGRTDGRHGRPICGVVRPKVRRVRSTAAVSPSP